MPNCFALYPFHGTLGTNATASLPDVRGSYPTSAPTGNPVFGDAPLMMGMKSLILHRRKHKIIAPTILPATGVFTVKQSVTMSDAEADSVRYTLDGTTPTSGSPAYSAPIDVTTSKVVKAIGVRASAFDSDVTTNIIGVNPTDVPTYVNTTLAVSQFGNGIKVITPAGTSNTGGGVSYNVYAKLGSAPDFTNSYLVAIMPELTIYFDRDADGAALADGTWHIKTSCTDSLGNTTQGATTKTVAFLNTGESPPEELQGVAIDDPAIIPEQLTGVTIT